MWPRYSAAVEGVEALTKSSSVAKGQETVG